MRTPLAKALIFAAACSLPAVAQAQITGNIQAKIILGAGCTIDNVSIADGTTGFDFGDLDFGTHPTNFDYADTSLNGSTSGFEVHCSADYEPELTFNGGLYSAAATSSSFPGSRAMKSTTNKYVTYDLYLGTQTSGTPIDTSAIALNPDGDPELVLISGRAYGPGTGSPFDAGEYTDTIQVTLSL